ncbi:MAG: hypothetical protein DMD31_09845 [Gemmatimonadetes bacterium]|nr:MAG: hypothetical protein DMD31_09845 [Gemmatimonadota bacterium]
MRSYVRLWPSLLAFGAACGGSSGPTSTGTNNNPPPTAPPTASVSMTDFAFTQAAITIKAGTMVKWVNNGGTSHTATSDGGVSPAFDSGTLAAPGTTTDPYGGTTTTPGGSYSTTFSTPGTYAYHCTFHGTLHNMTGTITVTQ